MIDAHSGIHRRADAQAPPRRLITALGKMVQHRAQHAHGNDFVEEHDRDAPHQRIKLGTADGEGVGHHANCST